MPLQALVAQDASSRQRARGPLVRVVVRELLERRVQFVPMLGSMQALLAYVQSGDRGAATYTATALHVLDSALQVSAVRTPAIVQGARALLPLSMLLHLVGNRGIVEHRKLHMLLLRLLTRVRRRAHVLAAS